VVGGRGADLAQHGRAVALLGEVAQQRQDLYLLVDADGS
jgi:hypothetical protein